MAGTLKKCGFRNGRGLPREYADYIDCYAIASLADKTGHSEILADG